LIERFETWSGKFVGGPGRVDRYSGCNNTFADGPGRFGCEVLPLRSLTTDRSEFCVSYAKYMVDFSIRHPIMYFLFYRWWLFYSMRGESREQLTKWIKHWRTCYPHVGHFRMSFWAAFALYHPVLVLLWIMFRSVLQFAENFVTAPCKAVYRRVNV